MTFPEDRPVFMGIGGEWSPRDPEGKPLSTSNSWELVFDAGIPSRRSYWQGHYIYDHDFEIQPPNRYRPGLGTPGAFEFGAGFWPTGFVRSTGEELPGSAAAAVSRLGESGCIIIFGPDTGASTDLSNMLPWAHREPPMLEWQRLFHARRTRGARSRIQSGWLADLVSRMESRDPQIALAQNVLADYLKKIDEHLASLLKPREATEQISMSPEQTESESKERQLSDEILTSAATDWESRTSAYRPFYVDVNGRMSSGRTYGEQSFNGAPSSTTAAGVDIDGLENEAVGGAYPPIRLIELGDE